MRRSRKIGIGVGVVGAIVIGALVCYYTLGDRYPRRFSVVVAGKIYRSAQPDVHGLKRVLQDIRIKTIINLRGPEVTDRNRQCMAEAKFAEDKGLKLVVIRFGPPPPDESIKKLLEVLDDKQNYPVLIHCAKGIERTGVAVAVYRMERMGWTSWQAVKEMLTNDFAPDLKHADDHDATTFVAEYKPRYPAQEKKP